MAQGLGTEAADFDVIFEDSERLTDLVGRRLKELVLKLEARPPSENAADIEPFPFDLEEHVPAQNPLGWDGVMGAAGRVNVMVAAKVSVLGRVHPALELHV